jgi:hypothetical protein
MLLLLCDLHPWMHSYIGILEHPFFATSDAHGAFRIEGVPVGTYTLEFWHRLLGTRTATVTVKAKATATVAGVRFSDQDLPPPQSRRKQTPSFGRLGWLAPSAPAQGTP